MKLSLTGELSLVDYIGKRFGAARGVKPQAGDSRFPQAGDSRFAGGVRASSPRFLDDVIIGIGDDAAAIRVEGGKTLVATTDTMTEGVHFTWGLSTPYQVGFKLISINVSDVYAMMADPAFALLSLTLPPDMEERGVWRMLDGVADALNAYGAVLVGGNVSSSAAGATVTATLLGYAGNDIARRDGARAGQRIYVTGPLGDSACGLLIMKKTGRPVALELGETAQWPEISEPGGWEAVSPLVRRHLMPLVKKPAPGRCGAMMDVSDGLLMDLRRLCEASCTGARLFEERLPVSFAMRAAAGILGADPVGLCLSGGEDYEYLFTADDGQPAAGALCIGEVVPEGFLLAGAGGVEKEWPRCGYEHFKV